jgi:hypothetical protein
MRHHYLENIVQRYLRTFPQTFKLLHEPEHGRLVNTMNFLCLNIIKRKKKEKSFNFVRLHPKQLVEPLVTPPATPLSFPPPKRPHSATSRADSLVSRFTERLELHSSFHETADSGLDLSLIPRPLSSHLVQGSATRSGGNVNMEREEEMDLHPYLQTSLYGVIDGSRRGGYNDEEAERKRSGGWRGGCGRAEVEDHGMGGALRRAE